jgi:hypothetical protein
MKYRLEGLTIENIDPYVRITLGNGRVQVTAKPYPSVAEVSTLLFTMQGYYPNAAQLIICGRAAADAKNSKIELDL